MENTRRKSTIDGQTFSVEILEDDDSKELDAGSLSVAEQTIPLISAHDASPRRKVRTS